MTARERALAGRLPDDRLARVRIVIATTAVAGAALAALAAVAPSAPAAPASSASSAPNRTAVSPSVGGFDHDLDGDGHADVVTQSTAGTLYLYRGDGRGGFLPRRTLPHTWRGFDQILQPGDWDGDGRADLVARRTSGGALFLYPGNGSGGLLARRQIGTGFGGFTQVIAPGDWDGDGAADLLSLRRSDMTLWLYAGDGRGGFTSYRRIGTGWQVRTTLTATGDWDGDGHVDLVARDARDGRLWLYSGNGRGGFRSFRPVGSGWNALTALVGPGDWSGDGRADLLARTPSGRLVLYRGNGSGGFTAPYPVVGTGWNPYLLNGLPAFAASVATVSPSQLPYSYRPGCPVSPRDLRLLHVTYYGFDDHAHTGGLVVRSTATTRMVRVFSELYAARFPIRRMLLVDAYGGSDDRSMAADNTSAFNCRRVSGSSSWSEHAYGEAVDVNPVENPYVVGSSVEPPAGRSYLERARYRRGMIRAGELAVCSFASQGWGWGGSWSGSKDYQHFSASGR